MRPIYIIGNNLQPLIDKSRWIGANNKERRLSNAVSIVNDNLVHFYLTEKTIKRISLEGKVLDKESTEKLLVLLSIEEDTLNMVKEFIAMEM